MGKTKFSFLIIGYFSPPGSVKDGGYYDESAFWAPANLHHRNEFINHWIQIIQLCKNSGYKHVLYNFLNEPQIEYFNDSEYQKIYTYRSLLQNLLSFQKSISDSNLVVIDGINYAQPDFRGYNFLNTSFESQFNNIIYDYHYYMYDFVWRRSNWVPISTYQYHNANSYYTTNSGYDTITYSTTLSGISQVNLIQFQSFYQRGRYKLKYFEIKNLSNNTNILTFDMAGKVIQNNGSENFIMQDGRMFKTNFGTLCPDCYNAQNSNMYMENNALVFSNTIKQDTNSTGIDWINSYCEFKYQRGYPSTEPSPLIIPVNIPLQIKIVVDGDSLQENGRFNLTFKQTPSEYIPSNHRVISNFVYELLPHETGITMSSHRDRVNAVFSYVKEMSSKLDKPFLLGEFAVPIEQRVPEKFIYFRDIWNNIEKDTINWAYHAYREASPNWKFINAPDSNGSFITVSLFSGKNATVDNIVGGISTGQTASTLLQGINENRYYYNKSLIDTLTSLLGGIFIKIRNISNIASKYYSLEQNYPNPFNPQTKIKFALPKDEFVKISIFDISGRAVANIVNEKLAAGTYEADFNGSNFASGTYFYKIEAGSFVETKKMILVK